MKTAFVTGATGFIGTNLVDELLTQGWRVVALHRPSADLSRLRERGVALVPGDITDAASVRAAMPEAPDAVFHVAASLTLWAPRHGLQRQINVEGTRNVVEAALARGAKRFVHTSTIGAYGIHNGCITEATVSNAPSLPINYARTKYLAEQEVRRGIDRGLQAVILNPANVMGPYDRHGWARLFPLVQTGDLPGVPPGSGSFAHVAEVARAHVAAVRRGRVGENYLLGGHDATYLEMVNGIARLVGRPARKRTLPGFLLAAAAHVSTMAAFFTRREPELTPEAVRVLCARMTCSSEKARREIGYVPRSLETMLADCHRWLLEEGIVAASEAEPARAARGPAFSSPEQR